MQELTSAITSKVSLSLGIFNTVVSVHAAVGQDESSKMRTVCTHNHAATPIKQHRTCPICGNTDGENKPFEKASAIDSDSVVEIPDWVLDKVKEETDALKRNGIAVTVHRDTDVSSVMLPSGSSYYLSLNKPSQAQLEAYAHIAKLIASRPDRAFMTRFPLRTAVSIFRLTTAGENTLMLEQMADAELVRKHPVVEPFEVDAETVEMVSRYCDRETVEFDVAAHGTARSTIIADYVAAQTPTLVPAGATDVPAAAVASNVIDIKATLANLLGASDVSDDTPAPARKRTPRKAAVKRASVKAVS